MKFENTAQYNQISAVFSHFHNISKTTLYYCIYIMQKILYILPLQKSAKALDVNLVQCRILNAFYIDKVFIIFWSKSLIVKVSFS